MPDEERYQKKLETMWKKTQGVIKNRFPHLDFDVFYVPHEWLQEHQATLWQDAEYHCGELNRIMRERGDFAAFERHVLAWCKLEIKFVEVYDAWLKAGCAPKETQGEIVEKVPEVPDSGAAPRPRVPEQKELRWI